MIYVFWIIGIIPIFFDLYKTYKTDEFNKLRVNLKDTEFKNLNDAQKSLVIFGLIYFVWNLIGIFTSQWLIFLFLFAGGLIVKNNKYLVKIDGIISLLLIMFAFINEFHLKLDLLNILEG